MKSYSHILFLTAVAFCFCNRTHAQVITTFAGTGTHGYSGDGSYANNAELFGPEAVAIDDTGNVYIADRTRIRKVNRAGIITTVAGNGTTLYNGDSIMAINASISPVTVAVDKKGNIYIAEIPGSRIRKVDTSGMITTIAGTGVDGYSGDGGLATAAELNWPQGIAIDDMGNVYIADESNQRIRKIDTIGIISTIAGTGNATYGGDGNSAILASLRFPCGVTVGKNGSLYITDYGNGRIRKIDSSGIITTIAGNTDGFGGDGGSATAAYFSSPVNVVIDSIGNLFIADAGNYRIRKIDTSGTITTVAGNNSYIYNGDGIIADSASISVQGVAVDGIDNLYIPDLGNARVRKVSGIYGTVSLCASSTSTLHNDIAGGKWISAAPAIATIDSVSGQLTAVAAGIATIYYVRYTDTATTPVTVIDTLPGAGTITGMATLCAGVADTLTDTVESGIWSSSNTNIILAGNIVAGVSSGTDTIVYTTTNACGISHASFVLTVNGKIAGPVTGSYYVCPGYAQLLTDTVTGGVWSTNDTSVVTIDSTGTLHPIAPGRDTVTYTITENGCTTVASYIGIVGGPSTIDSLTGAADVCAGMIELLTDGIPGGTFAATNGNATVTPNGFGLVNQCIVSGISPGLDTIIYQTANGCGTAMASFVVTVHAMVSSGSITATADSVCPGYTSILTDAVSGGIWGTTNLNIATVSSAGVVRGVTPGLDTITYTLPGSCVTPAIYPILVNTDDQCFNNAVSSVAANSAVSVYPNPSSGFFTISIPVVGKTTTITVYDLYGRTVKTQYAGAGTKGVLLDLNEAARGTYMLKVQNDYNSYTQKIVLE